MTERWAQPAGHPTALHRPGRRAARALFEARAQVAGALGAQASQVVFTSGGTEANQQAVHHLTRSGRSVVTCRTEHAAVLAPLRAWADGGGTLIELEVDPQGQVDLAALARALPGAGGLVLMGANNETGVLHDLNAVAQLVRAHGVWWHCDAVQVPGRLPLHWEEEPWSAASSLALTGHKLGGPHSTGLLLARSPMAALLPGLRAEVVRAGTPDVAACEGFARALTVTGAARMDAALQTALEAAITRRWPGSRVHGRGAPRLPNTTFVSLHANGWVDGEELATELALRGVAVGTGSACATGAGRPSHVLTAMGCSAEVASGAIRLSWGADGVDVSAVLAALESSLAALE